MGLLSKYTGFIRAIKIIAGNIAANSNNLANWSRVHGHEMT